jgi:ATP-dependent DNA helicase RecG
MSTSPEQIDVWRAAPTEDQHLEFKEARRQYDYDSICEYCVAIANEGGGHLILGVKNAPPREVVGTLEAYNPVGMAAKLFGTLCFRVDVEAVNHPGGRVVVFEIPSRPRGIPYSLRGAYFMRSGDQLVPMSEDQLRRIFAEGAPDWLDEPSVSGVDAQQVVELLDTQTFFELIGLPYPTDRNGVLDWLMQERLVSAAGGAYSIPRLGAILLARRLSDFPDLARKALRIIVYTGSSKLEARLDVSGTMGYAVGFGSLLDSIMGQLPWTESLESAFQTELTLVPEVVLRELLANALVHQDFRIGGGSVMVEVYSNRVEISNPGEPVVPIDRFIDGARSRNERLASWMRRLSICEERSSGIDRVVHAAEDRQLPAPDFRVDLQRTTATVFGPRIFSDMDREDRIRACYQHCVLKWVSREPMTNQSLRQRFRLPATKVAIISQIIAAAIEAGQIKLDRAVGTSRKFARYVPSWA